MKIQEKNILISDSKKVEELKKKFKEQGHKKMHVLSDFDRTLTHAFTDGEKVPSIISILRSNNKYLGKNYSQAAYELYNKYHPIEIDQGISFKDKKEKMREWWQAHFDLLVKSGLNKNHLNEILASNKLNFRKGALKFFDLLYKYNVPLVIISSSGVGNYIISMLFKKVNKLYPNIYIISNSLIWDKNGRAIGIKKPMIHCLNKDETILKNFNFYHKVEQRKNVLLLGDNIEDTKMIEGFDYDNLIKIGFLNEEVNKQSEIYNHHYDVVILDDSSMKFINEFLMKVVKD